MKKLIYFVTEDWYFCSHRLPLAKEAIKAGFEVVLITKENLHGDIIRSEGIRLIPISLKRRSMNPLREVQLILKLIKVYKTEHPDIVHHVAFKPVIYGSVASFMVGIPNVVNALAGLGYLFISKRFKAVALRAGLKMILKFLLSRGKSVLILQNTDDEKMLVENGFVANSSVQIIRGAGVDATIFHPVTAPRPPVKIILPARILIDKGVCEFVAAARIINRTDRIATFILVGMCDTENPSAVPQEQIKKWEAERVIEWWGYQTNMPKIIAQSHIVCLPSYREGLPKALLEAAACARPIVATDVPGCKEIVIHKLNGLLVPPRNAEALANAITTLIHHPDMRKQMGARGREIVLDSFSLKRITDQTIRVYQSFF